VMENSKQYGGQCPPLELSEQPCRIGRYDCIIKEAVEDRKPSTIL
jgi:hypothetical protein